MTGCKRGFTIVELLAYLALFTALTLAMLGIEMNATRVHRYENAHLRTLAQVDHLVTRMTDDLWSQTDPPVIEEGARVLFGNGVSYEHDVDTMSLWRSEGGNRKLLSSGVEVFRCRLDNGLLNMQIDYYFEHSGFKRRFVHTFAVSLGTLGGR